jgi:hypothetical protein
MENLNIFTHITDVWTTNWNWVDSTRRIEKQYNRLWVDSYVISAGNSPLHIAFVACSDLSQNAIDNTIKILKHLYINKPKTQAIALNCAPRNSSKSQDNGKENYIYRVKFENWETFLMYGLDVLSWVLEFHWSIPAVVEKIISIKDLIPDTSEWSQFRSWEHLPIVHF